VLRNSIAANRTDYEEQNNAALAEQRFHQQHARWTTVAERCSSAAARCAVQRGAGA
jgi:hypothetical protein